MVVKQAVERLENMEESFAPVLIKLGARHSANVDFSADNFTVFIKSLLYIWKSVLKDKMTPECTVAWKTLFGYIMLRLQQGFYIGKSEEMESKNSVKLQHGSKSTEV